MNRPTKALLGFAALSLAAYAGMCALLYAKQRTLLYYPQAAAPGSPARTLPLRSHGPRVLVSVRELAGRDAIVYFGGNAELVSANLPGFEAAFPRHALYLLHYRGYDGSEGRPTEANLYQDALDLFDYARRHHRNVIVVGRSLGSGLAVRVASARPAARLVLVTPYDSIVGIAAEQYPFFPVSLLLEDKYESFRYAPMVRAPTHIIMADADQVIPRKSTEQLFRRFRPGVAKMTIIPGANHNDVTADPRYLGLFLGP
jgi:pimeloyl-ACP methyl ester carboxylesterase